MSGSLTRGVHGVAEDAVLGHINEGALCLMQEQAASTMDVRLRGALLAPGESISKLAQGEEVPSSAFQGRLIPEYNADQM
jgi:hypothetical protein